MDRIRTAVVGLNHGLSHVVEVLANPRFRLVAVCTRSPKKLGWLRGEPALDGEPGWYRAHRTALLDQPRSEEHTSELQSHSDLVCRLLLEKKKKKKKQTTSTEMTRTSRLSYHTDDVVGAYDT